MDDQTKSPEALFTDTRGREWRLELNVTLAKEIRQATKLDLVNWHNGRALTQLGTDDELFVRVLWFFVCAQAESQGISEEEFGSGLGGDTLGAAEQALEVALINFSRPSRREVVKAIQSLSRQQLANGYQLAIDKLQGEATKRALQKGLAKAGQEFDRTIDKSSTGGS